MACEFQTMSQQAPWLEIGIIIAIGQVMFSDLLPGPELQFVIEDPLHLLDVFSYFLFFIKPGNPQDAFGCMADLVLDTPGFSSESDSWLMPSAHTAPSPDLLPPS